MSKLGVEDGIDDWIESAVDVSKPDEAGQHERVDMTERRGTGVRLLITGVVADTDCVDYVYGEERQPAEQKHRYTRAPTHTCIRCKAGTQTAMHM